MLTTNLNEIPIISKSESSAPEEFKGVVYSGEAPESDDGM